MSGEKHTPVKLHAVFNGHYWDVAVSPEDFSQCVGSCHRNSVLGYGLDGAERYARLFAAAPDLLEALTEARLTLSLTRTNIMVEMKKSEGTAYRWEGVPEALQARIVQCDDAIARARGEQDGGGE
ncbi:hypothetical protein V8J38_11395 [Brevundimonas olei]|uniref:Uncharacterized protein n=1 Tax=Brevundimonas olei TaxID=657642 RepID=A0ABZ2IC17_9CAUL